MEFKTEHLIVKNDENEILGSIYISDIDEFFRYVPDDFANDGLSEEDLLKIAQKLRELNRGA